MANSGKQSSRPALPVRPGRPDVTQAELGGIANLELAICIFQTFARECRADVISKVQAGANIEPGRHSADIRRTFKDGEMVRYLVVETDWSYE